MDIQQIININTDNTQNFSEMITMTFDKLMSAGQEIIKSYLKEKDNELLKSRDKKRYRCKGTQLTAVKTKIGIIEYGRRVYFDSEKQHHVFLLDEIEDIHCVGLFDNEICELISNMICTMPYRAVAETISSTTGLDISVQAVWDIVQEIGKRERQEIENLSELAKENRVRGTVNTKILFEEADGDWLKLQGKDREKYGASKEMKIGIAYDGVIHHRTKSGIRRELDNKVAFASFECADDFRRHKEAAIAAKYDVENVELRIKNGDGAQWIQKDTDCNCICVLDEFHRNKKITECVSDKKTAGELRELLLSGQYEDLLASIDTHLSKEGDEKKRVKLKELYSYYHENFDALSDYRSRGVKIPETRDPKTIHHARLGSMEGNVFTLIGNRMKGGRARWSIEGGNNLAAVLCTHHAVTPDYDITESGAYKPVLSAARVKGTGGKGYSIKQSHIIPGWLKLK